MIAALTLHVDLLWLVIGTFGWTAATWAAVGTGAAGAGLSLYGANKQAKDQAGADNANRAAVAEQDRNAWNQYLLQRGLYTGGTVGTGQIPGAMPGAAQNVKLPLWANIRPATPAYGGGPVVRRKAGR